MISLEEQRFKEQRLRTKIGSEVSGTIAKYDRHEEKV